MLRYFLDMALTVLKFVYFIAYRNSLFISEVSIFQAPSGAGEKVEHFGIPGVLWDSLPDFGADLILAPTFLGESSGESC